jgi:hypothetical protein
MNLDRLTSIQEFDFPLQSGNKDLKGKIKKVEFDFESTWIRFIVIPGFYAKTKYSSYAWPRINCSTHMAKSVHKQPNVTNKV